ncbi:MAG: hypothetical protein HY822_25290 [Acidobacteria bacterium]|nr:hypothetical protein [Acidobacteriota bacterium]
MRFDTRAPEIGPYPSDALTIEDAAQATGRRIDLPAVGQDYQLLNELDGFSPNARLRVRFSGPVNPETLKEGIRLLALDGAPADPIPVNQVVWDSSTYSAFAKPDRVLDQQRRYALLVTDAVRDTSGSAVEPDPAFLSCLQQTSGYCGELAKAIPPDRVVAASVFTTLSATSWLERARAALSEVATEYQRREGVSVFSFSDLGAVTLHMQTGADPAQFEEASLPFSLLSGVDKIAFGSFRSPNFLDSGQTIPAAPTKQALETPAAAGRIQFHALLPAREKPAAGYPVVIAGHGFGDNRFASPSALASSMAAQGLAVVAINAVGHGYGPETRLLLRDKTGRTSEVDGGGRSLDFNGDGKIEPQEGCLILSGDAPIGLRDCLRQTVADLMQLVRVLRAGVDLDGDGRPDLDPDRIYYAGISLGAIYGTMLNAVEPGIRSAVLNVGGGSVADIVRWGRSYHSYGVTLLGERGLLNREKDFDDAWPLRDKPVRVVEETSALEIQELFERMEWFHAQGDPLFFAGHLKKPILWMFARGDRSVPNPASSALVRAAGMRESAWLYRHDLARQILPSLDENPHAYLADLFSLASLPIALAAQQQAAAFLATGEINDPNALLRFLLGKNIFEVPDVLPEELNY